MKISVKDGSSYFRGMLLLIREDRILREPEIEMMKRIGKALGFEKGFCDNAIQDALDNPFIPESPPEFTSQESAKRFIKDGLTLAIADDEIHPLEEEWLKRIAESNGIDVTWLNHERESVANRRERPVLLEVDDMTVEY
jgi:hypothetical protein